MWLFYIVLKYGQDYFSARYNIVAFFTSNYPTTPLFVSATWELGCLTPEITET